MKRYYAEIIKDGKNIEVIVYGHNTKEATEWAAKIGSVVSVSFMEDVEENEGVKISSVSENSPAAKAGLKEDDIITEVNDKKVKDVDGIKPIIKGASEGTVFKFNITRNGKKSVIEVKIPKKLKTADL